MNYKLVAMDRSHLAEIAALERTCFSTPWSEQALEEELFNATACYIVAQDEDQSVLGYVGLHVVVDEGYITNVAVRPDCRRSGVADALLAVLERFGAVHLAFITLEVRAGNAPAIQLYMKHGYEQVGRRREYYQNPREDAILMTLAFEQEGTEQA